MRNVACAALLASLSSCAGASPPGAGAASHGQLAARALDGDATKSGLPHAALTRRATLRYELNGRNFPLPVVHGTVGGHPTWMLVDTGANSHVVAGWFARQIGMKLSKLGDVGTDHVGRTIATYRVEHPAVVIEQWGPLAEGPMLVTDVPALIEKLGIGAFISPQRLTEEGDAVVLDLAGAEMRAAWFDDAERALGTRGLALVGPGARLCEDTASPIQGLAYVLRGMVEGIAVDLLVDTGAQRSDILAGSAAGKALGPRTVANKDQMFGASGRLQSRTVKGARMVVSDVTLTSDVDLLPGVPDPYCPRDGVVSMDVLHTCTLVLGRAKLSARCAPQ